MKNISIIKTIHIKPGAKKRYQYNLASFLVVRVPQPSKNISWVTKAFIQSICLFYLYIFMNHWNKSGTY